MEDPGFSKMPAWMPWKRATLVPYEFLPAWRCDIVPSLGQQTYCSFYCLQNDTNDLFALCMGTFFPLSDNQCQEHFSYWTEIHKETHGKQRESKWLYLIVGFASLYTVFTKAKYITVWLYNLSLGYILNSWEFSSNLKVNSRPRDFLIHLKLYYFVKLQFY